MKQQKNWPKAFIQKILRTILALTLAITIGSLALIPDNALANSSLAGGRAEVVPFSSATVKQQTETNYKISWRSRRVGAVNISVSTSQNGEAEWKLIARNVRKSSLSVTIPAALAHADRVWFRIQLDKYKPITIADRNIKLEGAPNFRDLGGYLTKTGKWISMGKIFRSGDLSKLSNKDLDKLKRLNITTALDLRTTLERRIAPNRIPAGISEHQLNVTGDPLKPFPEVKNVKEARNVARSMYRDLVTSPISQEAYGALLDKITEAEGATVIFCNAGTHRTGLGASLVLDLLEVPSRAIEEDYLLSNEMLREENQKILSQIPQEKRAVHAVSLTADRSFLRAAFTQIRRTRNYYKGKLNITTEDAARLQKRLLS